MLLHFKLGIGLQFENWSETVALEVEIVAVGNFLVVETAAAVGKTAAAAAAAASEQAGLTDGICFLSETPVGF